VRLRLFLGMWAALACVIGVTVVAHDRLALGSDGGDQIVAGPDGDVTPGAGGATTTSAADPAVVPGPGQVRVHGSVTTLRLEGAVLDPDEVPTPVTIVSDRGFGNGGELTGVEVDGKAASIVWDGGRPFVLSSGGAIVVAPVVTELVPEGLRLLLGGATHTLRPGTYQLDTPVAVGTAGIATSMDTVTFVATDATRFEARGDAAVVLGPDAVRHLVGTGRIQLDGTLDLTDAQGDRTATTFAVELAGFDLTLTPVVGGGWAVDALVEE
jgi:hypothetical protein